MSFIRPSQVLVVLLVAALPAVEARTAPPASVSGVDHGPTPAASQNSMPLDLESALQRTLSSNPDLVALRQELSVSAAAVAVARHFPLSLNPSVSVDVRPWTFEQDSGYGSQSLSTLVSLSWMQPIEFGRRTGRRIAIARAEYSQTRWNVLQAELLALVETYRRHQTAAYRRDKLRVAETLAAFNANLVQTVRHRAAAGQVEASEVILAEVDNQSMRQVLQATRQEYVSALAAMRQQLGIPDCAATAVPAGPLQVPEGLADEDEANLTQLTLESYPAINAARVRAVASHAALGLAQVERIPVPSIGPVYESDESGATFYGLALSTPMPVLNMGKSLVCQREMEYHRDLIALEQLRVRTIARLRAAIVRWRDTKALIASVESSTAAIQTQAERMDRLFAAGQADVLKLLSVRQRLIEAENARLDMTWQAVQAYADLLETSGGTPLLGSNSSGQ